MVELAGFGAIALACGGFGYLFGGALGGASCGLLMAGLEAVWYANAVEPWPYPEADDADVP